MMIDSFTIAGAVGLLTTAVGNALLNPFKRRPHGSLPSSANCQPLSLVIITHNNAEDLAQTLPLWLEQVYPEALQIIVVTERGDSATENILKGYAGNQRLYTTFVPQSSRYMSREKLAVTLGVKAAKHNHIMLTQADCAPDSPHCLATCDAYLSCDDTRMAVGYVHYPHNDSYAYRHFLVLRQAYYRMRAASTKRPYGAPAPFLLFLKQDFIDGGGYTGNLQYVYGAYDFIVDKYGANAIPMYEPATQLTRRQPILKEWHKELLANFDTSQHLKGTVWYRLLTHIDQWALYLHLLGVLGVAIAAIATSRWLLLAIALSTFIITIVVRFLLIRGAITTFHETFSPWYALLYEYRAFWTRLATHICHLRAEATDFTTHKQ